MKQHITPRGQIILLGLICLFTILTGCKQTTTSSYDKDQIEQIFYNIRLAYQTSDIDGIMEYYHPNFLHRGQYLWQIRELWLTRMSEYPLVEFQNIDIDIQGDEAVATFTMKLEKPGEIVYSSEPAANGDLSYFIYDDDKWQVYGSQSR